MIKRALSITILFIICIFIFNNDVYSESNDIFYYVDNNVLYISSTRDDDYIYKKLINNEFDIDRKKITKVNILDNGKKIITDSMNGWFENFSSLEVIEGIENIDFSYVEDYSNLFANCNALKFDFIDKIDFTNGKNFVNTFKCCNELYEFVLTEKEFSNAVLMCSMFDSCNNLKKIDFSHGNYPNLLNISGMFWGCDSLEFVDFSFSSFANVERLNYLFSGCKSLNKVFLNDSFFGNVKEMEAIFYNCHSIELIDLSTFDLSNLYRLCEGAAVDNCLDWEYESGFANHCYNLKKVIFPIGNIIKIHNMAKMFYDCPQLREIDISMFDLTEVHDCYGMFYNCNSLEKIYINSNYQFSNLFTNDCEFVCGIIDYDESMFGNCKSLVGVAGTTYNEKFTNSEYARVDEGPDNPGYFTDIADYKPLDENNDNSVYEETDLISSNNIPIIIGISALGILVIVISIYLIKRKRK